MEVTKEIDEWIRANYRNVANVDFILECERGKIYTAHVEFYDRISSHFAGSQWVDIPLEIIRGKTHV